MQKLTLGRTIFHEISRPDMIIDLIKNGLRKHAYVLVHATSSTSMHYLIIFKTNILIVHKIVLEFGYSCYISKCHGKCNLRRKFPSRLSTLQISYSLSNFLLSDSPSKSRDQDTDILVLTSDQVLISQSLCLFQTSPIYPFLTSSSLTPLPNLVSSLSVSQLTHHNTTFPSPLNTSFSLFLTFISRWSASNYRPIPQYSLLNLLC